MARWLSWHRLQEYKKLSLEEKQAYKMKFVASLKQMPLAIAVKDANEQHYEVPVEFFKLVMAKRMKYSASFYPTGEYSCVSAERVWISYTRRHRNDNRHSFVCLFVCLFVCWIRIKHSRWSCWLHSQYVLPASRDQGWVWIAGCCCCCCCWWWWRWWW